MGGGKALVNAYYRLAERLGVQVRYYTVVHPLELHQRDSLAALAGRERLQPKTSVIAAAVFYSHR
ncbi:hypothetical protein [Salmonella enterica]|uniref:hypothetical protein n=1 Tax=Salmonella enterica TaxID=28901 RepID=UPI00398C6A1C